MNFWVLLYRFAWIVVIVSVVIGIVCVFLPKCHSFQELQKRKLTLEESNARLDARVREMEKRQERFRNDSEFVERIAREQGMVKPGETVYKFMTTNNTTSRGRER